MKSDQDKINEVMLFMDNPILLEIVNLLRDGGPDNYILSIKTLRCSSPISLGLREAKDVVDNLIEEYQNTIGWRRTEDGGRDYFDPLENCWVNFHEWPRYHNRRKTWGEVKELQRKYAETKAGKR